MVLDLEGNNLSRHGSLSLVTILVAPRKKVYLVDVTTLTHDAFDSAGSDGSTLRSILESSEVFFDIRHDFDALFSLYGVRVQGIEDLHLMELALRNFNRRHINGLAKCIERDSRLGFAEKRAWQRTKEKGRELFDPDRGGSYAMFHLRPLSPAMTKYCVQDVVHMPHLRDVYRAKLCNEG